MVTSTQRGIHLSLVCFECEFFKTHEAIGRSSQSDYVVNCNLSK